MTRTAPKRLLSRSFAVRTVADTLLTRPLAQFRSVLAEFPTPWRCSDIHFEDIVLDGVGVGISVDMTYETPGSTHENIGCTAKGVTCVISPFPLLCRCVCALGV